MPRPVDRRAAYFPGLDGLRVVAVALVIAYHVGVPHIGGGLLGVGIFFTLSGYLITSLLLTSWHARDAAGLARFWRRRFRRLLPAVVLLLAAVLLTTALVRTDKLHEWGTQALAALFYVANWATIAKGDTYFNRFEGPSPLEHLWSLSIEEQFYLAWPLLLIALLVVLRGNVVRAGLVTFVLGAASMIEMAILYQPTADATRVYEGTDTRAGGLLWGAALALLWHPVRSSAVTGWARVVGLDILGLAGMAGIVGLSYGTQETSPFLYRGGIALLTVATCLTLVAVTHPQTLTSRVLGLPALRWLGERTYGIYLWHMPLSAFLPAHAFYGHTVIRGLVIVLGSVILAALSWRYVENPIRRWGLVGAWKRGTRATEHHGRRALPAFVTGGLALTVAASAALAGVSKLPQTSVQDIAKDAARHEQGQPKATPTPTGSTPAVAYPTPGQTLRTSCPTVAHIGDSTSLGLSDGPLTELTQPSERIEAQYHGVGVHEVIEDIKGARSIFEHFKSDTNGIEAVTAQTPHLGTDGCLVVALGMNDAATMALGGTNLAAGPRIDKIMQAAAGHRVLWVNTITQAWASMPGYQNANMVKFNAALLEATKRWPNLRIYDWAAEAQPQPGWFLTADANHNNALGSREKAHRIAQALAVAFPADTGKSPSSVVRTQK